MSLKEAETKPKDSPPRAERLPHTVRFGEAEWSDPYHWLRDKENPAVRAHLEAENAHTERLLAPQKALREEIFRELVARVQEDDVSVPRPDGAYCYYRRTIKGQNYSLICRHPREEPGSEEILLDVNALAAGKEFYSLGVWTYSDDHRLLVYGADEEGDEALTLMVRDLATGEDTVTGIERAAGHVEWSGDGAGFYYTLLDEHHRPRSVHYHRLGKPGEDLLIYEEPDDRFFVGVGRGESRRFLYIEISGQNSDEAWVLPADAAPGPGVKPRLLEARAPDHEFDVSDHGSFFYFLTNRDALDHRLVRAPEATPGHEHWQDVVPHEPGRLLESFQLFRDHLVLEGREEGLPVLLIYSPAGDFRHRVPVLDDAVYSLSSLGSLEFATDTVRLACSSPARPLAVYDYDMASGERTLRKEQKVPDPSFDPANYVVERHWAASEGDAKVPVTVLRRRETACDGSAPVYLYAYGSYGMSMEGGFGISPLSLVDRGMMYAIAHVRGGMELGRRWYLDGKLVAKENTFSDFVAAAEHLVGAGYGAPGRIVASGGSAGGMLMGVVANRRPDLWAGIIADVPFVDVVNTMIDDTLPLTTAEYNEWGDPRDPQVLERLRRYSPYDNVSSQAYPPMLVIAGLNDPRVTYWEPAKWVAALRHHSLRPENPILLWTDLGAGHGGASGRYDRWKEAARDAAFALSCVSAP